MSRFFRVTERITFTTRRKSALSPTGLATWMIQAIPEQANREILAAAFPQARRVGGRSQSGFGKTLAGVSGGVSSRAALAASNPFSSVSRRRNHAAVDGLVL